LAEQIKEFTKIKKIYEKVITKYKISDLKISKFHFDWIFNEKARRLINEVWLM
jgi:hypothetical protein